MSSEITQVRRINQALAEMYGTDLVNAKRVINTKLTKNKPNPENLTLAERILLNRRKGTQPEQNSRKDSSPSDSVDISDLTNQNDERRTPTPEPTRNHRSPVKRQESKRSIASEQPGPSNRKSATPPLPPIKSASPRPETKNQTPRQSRAQSRNKVESRRETPVLPPIARKDSRADSRRQQSRVSIRSEDGIQPPKDMREFDPNLGVGEVEPSPTPQSQRASEPQTKKEPEAIERKQDQPQAVPKQETKPKSPEVKPKSPEKQPPAKSPERQKARSPERPKSPDKTNVVPVVAAAATSSQRARSRSRSRSRSRHRTRSRSRSRSRSKSRKKSRRRSSSRSRSRSRRRSRRSRSRKRHRSSSYSSSSSPRRRRRYSSSPVRRHRSRGRSRSRRRSFDYDFERAKSFVRSLSRMDTFSRPRHRSPSIEYTILGGNGGFWPANRPESARKKKKIIIVQGGAPAPKTKRRNQSSSDSDISVVVKNVKSKSRGKREKTRRVSESEESESDSSRSKSRAKRGKKKQKSKSRRDVTESEDTDEEETTEEVNISKKKSKKSKSKKNIRFDLKNISSKKGLEKKTAKKVTVESDNESEPEVDENKNIPKFSQPVKPVAKAAKKNAPIVEKQEDVHAGYRLPTPDSPLPSDIPSESRNQTPISPQQENTQTKSPPANKSPNKVNKPQINKQKPKNPQDEDKELQEALNQLDKRTDFELEQLKGGNQRKLPPDVNLDMKKKIFSKEFQQNINNFLES